MKYLAIDYGLKRVGIAVSDMDGNFAFPRCTLKRETRAAFFAELLAVSAFFGCIKGLKDIRKRFGSNMRTGIADFEGKARIILVLIDTEKGEADCNLAFFAGGLERVLYEIDQDTADPCRITVKGL